MENAKKNLVFHFGVGRQASFLKIGYVKLVLTDLEVENRGQERTVLNIYSSRLAGP